MKGIILFLLMTSMAFANLDFAPTNFKIKNMQTVYIDIQNIETEIVYDITSKTATATSIVKFKTKEEGHPIFDLKSNLLSAQLNGKDVLVTDINDPDSVTRYKLVNQNIFAGDHELTLKNTFSTNIKFGQKSVQSAFWMSDLTDRKYIEQYLPSNLEYDAYQMDMTVKIIGKTEVDNHEVFTNGFLTKKDKNHFKVSFPEYFTSSSFFFHLSKLNKFTKDSYRFASISGKQIPVTVYSSNKWNVDSAMKNSKKVLTELEGKLGAWSHPSLVIYVAGSGGMEHSGATITSLWALGHEIIHSYFARGVMPMDGNSGWIDEAIASWRDDGYRSVRAPNFSSTRMGAHSQYRRTTDRKAYTEGANFMAYLNNKLENHGGLISFLSELYENYSHKSITTKMFKKEIELYSGIDFTQDFQKYIWGVNAEQSQKNDSENPYHPKLSKQDLLDLL